ncbi:protein SLC31A2-like [Neocloeon triangulifer]|uniref:protein SLC31A2-like n=1 Tax=Neocloeon triangulifer TaxID=2078957 RepID=UPI00286F5F15|nr:protein SLC31A2-like [Neocloeon triangulifer]
MESTFWAGYQLGLFLFPGFKVTTLTGFVFTCVAAGSLAFLTEAVKVFLLARARRKEQFVVPPQEWSDIEETPLVRIRNRRERNGQSCMSHSSDTAVYLLYSVAAYLQMLAVMSFNVWLFLSVIFGSSAGYAIFSQTPDSRPKLIFPIIKSADTSAVQSPTDSIDPERTFSEASVSGADTLDTTAIVHRTEDVA